jgi:uncharacterized protein
LPDTVGSVPATARYRVRPFRPAWWLRPPDAQTIVARLLRPRGGVEFRRERIDTADGDFLDLDYAAAPSTAEAPLVLLLHGLEGSTQRGYMVATYRALAAHGLRAVGLNFRSCSGEPNRLARMYHSGDTNDLRHVLDHLAARFPDAPMCVIGYSLGGNVLLKYLGEEGDAAAERLRAAVAVSVPFDLVAGARKLEQGLGRIYTWFFLRSLRRKVALKLQSRPDVFAEVNGRCNLAGVRRARRFRDFDDAFTAPLHGFTSADDYYRRSSSAAFIEAIRIPTLLLHSRDDPFLPTDAIPHEAAEQNPHVTAEFTDRGGHVGFICGGSPWSPVFWAEVEAARFIAAQLRPKRKDYAATE